MDLLGWLIVVVPVAIVIAMAVHSRKYVRGVADYLAAGRVAGRYIIAVGGLELALGVITLVAAVEVNYQTGFALSFWSNVLLPLSMVMALTGYCSYRFRETRVLSIGQFLEIRYNRAFRIFASGLRTFSEMLTNMIGPAVAARFFIYLLGFPQQVNILGMQIPVFALVMILTIVLALVIIWSGGMVALIITDAIQGLMSYPIFVIITVFILTNFSWNGEIVPVMVDKVKGESFINPYDIQSLRDFNLFALIVTIMSQILNRASWIGSSSDRSGRTPHEQKMAAVLGTWRNGFSLVMCVLIAIAIITTMCHTHYADTAKKIRTELSTRVAQEVVPSPAVRGKIIGQIKDIPPLHHYIGEDEPLSRKKNLDTPYLDVVQKEFRHNGGDGNESFQQYRTLYHQMMFPIAIRNIMPPVLLGVFCLLMGLLMISTDDSRMFSSALTIIQDVIMPFRKTPLTPNQHIWWVRICALFVGVFFFFGSLFLSQLDYINLFCIIMTSIWLGGAGPVMVFGLYSRFGTTAGAFASLITGAGFSIGGIFVQRNWADTIYPWLAEMGYVDGMNNFLVAVSSPFSPYIVWKMDSVKFPINSNEIFFMAMVLSICAYLIVSWITYKTPFNLERMLHRGKYNVEIGDDKNIKSAWNWRNVYGKLIGITPEYTRGDKIIAWSVFIYTFIYQFLLAFCGVVIWNMLSPWPADWWGNYFLIVSIAVPGIVAAISTVWFMIGGIIDMRRLFIDLAARKDNPLDDGRVEGHVSLVDVDFVDEIE